MKTLKNLQEYNRIGKSIKLQIVKSRRKAKKRYITKEDLNIQEGKNKFIPTFENQAKVNKNAFTFHLQYINFQNNNNKKANTINEVRNKNKDIKDFKIGKNIHERLFFVKNDVITINNFINSRIIFLILIIFTLLKFSN